VIYIFSEHIKRLTQIRNCSYSTQW